MKYPIYKQDNHYSCGAYCILMILRYHHCKEEIKNIKEKCKLTPAGISVYGMIKCLEEYNIEAKAYQCSLKDIEENVKLPCIIHTIHENMAHYMVLYAIDKQVATIGDPGSGLVKMPLDKLEQIFSGVCISIIHVGRMHLQSSYFSFYQFIYQHFKTHYHQVLKIVGYSTIISILSIVGSFYFQMIIDTVHQKEYFIIVLFTMLFMFLSFVKTMTLYIRKRFSIYIKKELDDDYVNRTIQNMVYLPLHYFVVNQEGVLLNKIKNLYQLSEFFIHMYTTLFMDTIFVIMLLIGICILNSMIGILVSVVLTIVAVLCYKCLQKINHMNKEVLMKDDAMHQTILEYIYNMFMIHQYHHKQIMKNKIGTYFTEYQQAVVKREHVFNVLNSIIEGILQGLLYIVVLLACLLYKQGLISIGDSIVFYMLVSYAIDPLLHMIALLIEKEEIHLVFERYKDILPAKKKKLKKIKKITSITLEQVTYSYGYSKPIFEHLDLTITKSMWLQGETGSGKSTLLQLMMGYDEVVKGEIRINDRDIKEIDRQSLYQRMFYVHKQPVFFNETLRFNLVGVDRSKEHRLLELLQLFSVEQLSNHLDETISKDGGFLSSGQQQIVMIIRAILKNPDVLILDEALSNIDEHRARKILLYIENCLKGTIVILVNHQTNVVNVKYDCVIMKDGNIIHGE